MFGGNYCFKVKDAKFGIIVVYKTDSNYQLEIKQKMQIVKTNISAKFCCYCLVCIVKIMVVEEKV